MFLRRLIAVAASFLLLASTALAVVNYNDRTVTRLWDSEGAPHCTGFFVTGPPEHTKSFAPETKYWVMTAKHCVDEGVTVGEDVYSPKMLISWAKLLDSDVALGLVSYTNPHLLKIAKEFPNEGARVFIHGYGFAVENIVMGEVWANDERLPEYRVVRTMTGDIWPGNSGSPVLNEQGDVVGLVTALGCKPGMELFCMMRLMEAVDTRQVYVTPISTFAYPAFWPNTP